MKFGTLHLQFSKIFFSAGKIELRQVVVLISCLTPCLVLDTVSKFQIFFLIFAKTKLFIYPNTKNLYRLFDTFQNL
jgi:hypothetical protein